MFKIDIHTHILPPQMPKFKDKFGYGGFLEYRPCAECSDVDLYDDSGKFFRRVQNNSFSAEQRLKDYDDFGVHLQVLSTLPALFLYWTKPKDGLVVAQYINDHIAKTVSDNPKKFVGFGTLPLQDPELSMGEVERCVNDLGLSGFQIGSHIHDMNLSDPKLFPIYQLCQSLGVSLFVHPWDMMGKDRMPNYWLPWLVGMPAETSLAICSMIFGGVFEKFPNLRVAFAHGGGAFPITWARVQKGYDSRPDLCGIDNPHPPQKYLGHFYLDSLVHDPETLKYIIKLVGHKKICIGSDYPFPLGEDRPGALVENLDLKREEKEWLCHLSALELLGKKKEDFI